MGDGRKTPGLEGQPCQLSAFPGTACRTFVLQVSRVCARFLVRPFLGKDVHFVLQVLCVAVSDACTCTPSGALSFSDSETTHLCVPFLTSLFWPASASSLP